MTNPITNTGWSRELLAQDCGWPGLPFRWDEGRRFLLRCDLDAAFYHRYLRAERIGDWRAVGGETAEELVRLKASFQKPRDAVAYIMDTFPIVRCEDEEKFNDDNWTECAILEICDAMTDAIRTGQPCQTRLDPLPAGPGSCHPPRNAEARMHGAQAADKGGDVPQHRARKTSRR